jgi:hypothetical protein
MFFHQKPEQSSRPDLSQLAAAAASCVEHTAAGETGDLPGFLWPLAVTRWANETENGDLRGFIADL